LTFKKKTYFLEEILEDKLSSVTYVVPSISERSTATSKCLLDIFVDIQNMAQNSVVEIQLQQQHFIGFPTMIIILK
jgi:hypothetical protein